MWTTTNVQYVGNSSDVAFHSVETLEWLVDSGATKHMTPFETDFSCLTFDDFGEVMVGNGNTLAKTGKGTICL